MLTYGSKTNLPDTQLKAGFKHDGLPSDSETANILFIYTVYTMNQLKHLLNSAQLWHSGRRSSAVGHNSLTTGHRRLDRALHSRGWPLAGSTELLCESSGIGELSLLRPALAKLSQEQFIAWLNPPFEPYAPALQQAGINPEHCLFIQCPNLQDQLWAAEELLRASAFAAILNWCGHHRLADRDLRRLQLAARDQNCWHLHFRASAMSQQSSPAPLRIGLTASGRQLQISILKQSGGPAGQQIHIERDAALFNCQSPASHWPQPSSHSGAGINRLLLTSPINRGGQQRKLISATPGKELH